MKASDISDQNIYLAILECTRERSAAWGFDATMAPLPDMQDKLSEFPPKVVLAKLRKMNQTREADRVWVRLPWRL